MKSVMYACCEEDLDFLRAYLAGLVLTELLVFSRFLFYK